MKLDLNKLWIGIFFGMVAPIVVLLFSNLITFSHLKFGAFVSIMFSKGALTPLISLCTIINLLIFFLFIWTHRYYAARGVIFSTFIYAIFVFIMKLN